MVLIKMQVPTLKLVPVWAPVLPLMHKLELPMLLWAPTLKLVKAREWVPLLMLVWAPVLPLTLTLKLLRVLELPPTLVWALTLPPTLELLLEPNSTRLQA